MPDIERDRLRELESVISEGLKWFMTAGAALREIRDFGLYKAEHSNFKVYCERQWGISRSRAYELITASDVHEQLSEFSDNVPTVESHARTLAKLDPEDRADVWEAVWQETGGKPTAQDVERAVKARKPTADDEPTAPPKIDRDKYPIAVVLDRQQHQEWERFKEIVGLRTDKKAFLRLLENGS